MSFFIIYFFFFAELLNLAATGESLVLLYTTEGRDHDTESAKPAGRVIIGF